MRILIALLLLVPLALAADDTTRIEFDPPVTREDGTALDRSVTLIVAET